MKRNMELVRSLLQRAEALECDEAGPHELFKTTTYEEAYQVALMKDAGLIDGDVGTENLVPASATIYRLTWEGHDFLDAVREDTVWNKIKKNVIKPGASWTFALVVEYAKLEIKNRLFGTGGSTPVA